MPPQQTGSAPISIERVRRLFDRPQRVAESDFLRREIAGRMFERLELIKVTPETVLDAGCGEGADFAMLHQRFPQARLIGIDAAPAMLGQLAKRQQRMQSVLARLLTRLRPRGAPAAATAAADLLCGDFARLPLRDGSAGLLWSNLALHWHPQPDQVFVEWRRVLRSQGLLMFSCFGPDTFRELRAAGDGAPQVLPFVDMHDLGDMLVHAGFATPVIDMEMLTLTYGSIDRLIADVRAFGGNPLETRVRGMTARAVRDRLYNSLERNRNADGKLTLSIEVVYGHAFCPEPRLTRDGEAIVRFMPRHTK